MKRTINLVTTARANGAQLPAEWWMHCECCVECSSPLFPFDGYFCEKEGCVAQFKSAKNFTHGQRYIGPDLELAENIHHAFMVADALCVGGNVITGGRLPADTDKLFWAGLINKEGQYTASAPERHLALVAACEAALGIERGEVEV